MNDTGENGGQHGQDYQTAHPPPVARHDVKDGKGHNGRRRKCRCEPESAANGGERNGRDQCYRCDLSDKCSMHGLPSSWGCYLLYVTTKRFCCT